MLEKGNIECLSPYVIDLTDNRADPKRFLDINASIVLCIDA
jgi:hypothetical protein